MRSTSSFLDDGVSIEYGAATREASTPENSNSSRNVGQQTAAERENLRTWEQHHVKEDGAENIKAPGDEEIGSPNGHQNLYSGGTLPQPSTVGRRLSFIEEDESHPQSSPTKKESPVSWKDLPNKGQLAILTMARLSEPLTQTSLQAYMFYQLKSFDPSSSDSTIASQAGLLQGSFTAAQFVTAILWGRAADSDWVGRKKVLLIGLLGTCLSCVGFGFSRSFVQAAIFRTLGGALNGNVGVMRTMIAEIIREKK